MPTFSPEPTDRQLDVLRAIDASWKAGGPPSIRELCEAVGINSTFGVVCHLRALKEKGLLSSDYNKARSLALTDLGRARLYGKVPSKAKPKKCGECGAVLN